MRRRDPQAKRRQLLAAAQDLFAEQGFDATSTAQVAQRAGVSEGILFHHFGNKKNLFLEILAEYARAAAQATMPAADSELTEESVVRGAFDFADANPQVHAMLAWGSAQFGALELDQQGEIIVDVICGKLEAGMDQGKVRLGDARIMAQLQFAVVDAAYKEWRRSADPDLREAYIGEAVRCMQAMLAPLAGR